MNTKLVVFDMAGTTVADKGNVADAFIGAFYEQQLEVPFEAVQNVMGYRKTEAILMLLNEFYPTLENKSGMIKPIHDLFEEKMLEYYMSVQDLKPLPFTEDIFRWLQIKNIMTQLCLAVDHIHQNGIIHADIKPLNIMRSNANIVLIDLDASSKIDDDVKFNCSITELSCSV
jgi:serine/threonine protein kinase